MALTKRDVDAARYKGNGKSRDVRWDGEDGVPGFGLRIYPSGKKSFVLQFRGPDRRVRLLTIGRYGVLTVDEARKRARRHLVEVMDGVDPLEERHAPQDLRLREFAPIYLERHAKPHKRSWKEDERRLNLHVLPALGAKPLSSIHRADVAKLHSAIGAKAPIEANRVLTLVGTVFSKAEELGFLPEGHANPAKRIKRFAETSRDRWLKPEEVVRLFAVLAKEKDPYISAGILLLLLTGTRKSELLSARWEDVDLERCELRLRDTKSGRPHVVPLSAPAVHVLRTLPRAFRGPWIFPGEKGGHRKDWKHPWTRIRKKAGLADVHLHDLRRTLGSWMAQAGVPLLTIGEVLNHAHPDVTKVYARLSQDQARDALDAFGEKLVEVTGLPIVEVGQLAASSEAE